MNFEQMLKEYAGEIQTYCENNSCYEINDDDPRFIYATKCPFYEVEGNDYEGGLCSIGQPIDWRL